MNPGSRARLAGLFVLAALVLPALRPAMAQSGWSGWARCVINIGGAGYTDTETHTWMVSNATAAGSAPGNWTAVGSGEYHVDDGTTRMDVAFSINPGSTVNSGGQFRAMVQNGVVRVFPHHAQLRLTGAIQGYVLQTISGNQRTPTPLAGTQYEWQFPLVQGPATSTTLSGSSTGGNQPGWGTMRPAAAALSSSCTWLFALGSQPPPPPPVAASPVPQPPSPGTPPPNPPPGQPPTGQPPADPCGSARLQLRRKESAVAVVHSTVPREWRAGSRVLVCGSGLGGALFEAGAGGERDAPEVPADAYVYLGDYVLAVSNPVVSPNGDRIELTVGALHEPARRRKDLFGLWPPQDCEPATRCTGPLGIRMQGQPDPIYGPKVRWQAQ
jgi:hypothetical protein